MGINCKLTGKVMPFENPDCLGKLITPCCIDEAVYKQ